MSDNEGNKSAKGWTNRQRLAYFFNLVEFSNVKLDFTNAPRPDGKSPGACRIMIERLKGTLKAEIAALRGDGSDGSEANTTPKKTATTPRKRKAASVKEVHGTPLKRGRKMKGSDEEVLGLEGDVEVEGVKKEEVNEGFKKESEEEEDDSV